MSTREFPENRIFGLFAQKLRFAVYFQHNQSLAITPPTGAGVIGSVRINLMMPA
ncbi:MULTISPECIES: hypothetical protein [Aeromonas]|nr:MULTISPECIES: hypothetical protein [Aeromonas]EKP0300024.1 hypothetical protein [Aeromonas veronii]MBL0476200.1 hypothetical protein [Aeromonas veronii]MBL0566300.1 hypothetical protein [Aeromonas veronii]MCD6619538.1 hypothetical protein [Aeromonas veronii]MCF5901921.1 hypothetical protein [Aeromonas veronii]